MLRKIVLFTFIVGTAVIFERYYFNIHQQLTSLKSDINILKGKLIVWENRKTARETELRQMRKQTTALEEQYAIINKHTENMEAAIEKLGSDTVQQRSTNMALQGHLDALKINVANSIAARETELRQVRKQTTALEEQYAILNKHTESMKAAIEKLENYTVQQRSTNMALQGHLDALKTNVANSIADTENSNIQNNNHSLFYNNEDDSFIERKLKTRLVKTGKYFVPVTILTLNDGTAWISYHNPGLICRIDEDGVILQKIPTKYDVFQFQRGIDSSWLYSTLDVHLFNITYSLIKIIDDNKEVPFIDTEPLIPFSLHVTSSGVIYVGCVEVDAIKNRVTDAYYKSYILKLTEKGVPVQKYERGENKNMLFKFPLRIHENTNGDIWICDWNNIQPGKETGNITVLDKNGTPKFNYTGVKSKKTEQPFLPTDFASIGNGIMLVLDGSNNIIHVVNEHGRFLYFLGPDEDKDFKKPVSMGFDKINQKLWVGTKSGPSLYILDLD